MLRRFCTLKGDYDSILLLLTPAPPFAPAMDVKTIDEFLRCKTSHPGTELKISFSSQPLKDWISLSKEKRQPSGTCYLWQQRQKGCFGC
jgi:hypothetical protein